MNLLDIPNNSMSTTQASVLTVERSLYPKSQLFKPKLVVFTSVAQALRAYEAVMGQPIPPTEEDAAWDRQWSRTARPGYAGDSFDDKSTSAWSQVGRYWVRHAEGSHPNCHTLSRVGATVNWRTAPDSYCCAGFPYFHEESMERFRHTMEMVKPLIRFKLPSTTVTLCLERDLEGPVGCCWGIRTGGTYLRFVKSMDSYFSRGRVSVTKAALHRELVSIFA